MRARICLPKTMHELQALEYDKMKELWFRYFKDPPSDNSPLRPDYRMLRMLWYKIQCEIHDLHIEQKNITKLNRYSADPEKFIEKSYKAKYQLKNGMEIVKTYKGRQYKVYVKSPEEFIYNDQSFKTLSAVALAICNNKVSGYDFFGLNNKFYEKSIVEDESILREESLDKDGSSLEDDICKK